MSEYSQEDARPRLRHEEQGSSESQRILEDLQAEQAYRPASVKLQEGHRGDNCGGLPW